MSLLLSDCTKVTIRRVILYYVNVGFDLCFPYKVLQVIGFDKGERTREAQGVGRVISILLTTFL